MITVTIRVDVHDPKAFARYATRVLGLVEAHGGQVIAAGPATAVEGVLSTAATWAFVQRWPDESHFHAFYSDPAYQPLKAERHAAASTELLIIGPQRDAWRRGHDFAREREARRGARSASSVRTSRPAGSGGHENVAPFAAALDDHRFPVFGDDLPAQAASAEKLRDRCDRGATVLPGHDPDVLRPGAVSA